MEEGVTNGGDGARGTQPAPKPKHREAGPAGPGGLTLQPSSRVT
jgi:hypothetical protein